MENNQAMVLSFQLKVPVFFLVWGFLCGVLLPSVYYGLSVCRLIWCHDFLPVGITFALKRIVIILLKRKQVFVRFVGCFNFFILLETSPCYG